MHKKDAGRGILSEVEAGMRYQEPKSLRGIRIWICSEP